MQKLSLFLASWASQANFITKNTKVTKISRIKMGNKLDLGIVKFTSSFLETAGI